MGECGEKSEREKESVRKSHRARMSAKTKGVNSNEKTRSKGKNPVAFCLLGFSAAPLPPSPGSI
jgi:hypothetical protein